MFGMVVLEALDSCFRRNDGENCCVVLGMVVYGGFLIPHCVRNDRGEAFGMAGGEVQGGGKYPVFILVGAADKIHLQRKSRSYKM